jgi:hypothetical protein
MIMDLIEKQKDQKYFQPGDTVVLRQPVTNKPVMIVKSVDRVAEVGEKPKLAGIRCQWFNTRMELQSAMFSTKDLEDYDGEDGQ